MHSYIENLLGKTNGDFLKHFFVGVREYHIESLLVLKK